MWAVWALSSEAHKSRTHLTINATWGDESAELPRGLSTDNSSIPLYWQRKFLAVLNVRIYEFYYKLEGAEPSNGNFSRKSKYTFGVLHNSSLLIKDIGFLDEKLYVCQIGDKEYVVWLEVSGECHTFSVNRFL